MTSDPSDAAPLPAASGESLSTPAKPAGLGGIKDSAIVFTVTMVAAVGGLAIQSCLAWTLGPEGRGAYGVCLTFASILAVLFTLGTDRSVQYHVISRRFSMSEGISITFLTMLAGSAVAVAVGWFLIELPIPFFDKAEPWAFRAALALIPVVATQLTLDMLLVGRRRFVYRAAMQISLTSSLLLLTLVLVAVFRLGVLGAISALFFSMLLVIVLQLCGLWSECETELMWPRLESYRSLLHYGVRCFVGRFGSAVNARIGLLVLAWLATRQELSFFVAASALLVRVQTVPQSINQALLPRVGADPRGRPHLVAQSARFSFAIVTVSVVALAALSIVLVPILLSPAFAPSIQLIWILAPGVCLRCATQPMVPYFLGTNRPGINSLAMVASLTTTTLIMVLLYPHIGVTAAAVAVSVGTAARSLLFAFAFARTSGLSFRETWLWQRNDYQLLATLGKTALRRMRKAVGAD